jgi:hypothetical protein
MIFRTYEHYPNNEIFISDSNYDNICIICFHHDSLLINLNEQALYSKQCNCEATIHIHCLRLWYSHAQKCPICRGDMMIVTQHTRILFTFKRIMTMLYALTIAHFIYVMYYYILLNYSSSHEL